MRNPERIPRIIELLGQLWDKFPDMRLGQLLSNFVFGLHTDIWFQDDDKNEARLVDAIKFYTKVEKKNEKFKQTNKSKSRKVKDAVLDKSRTVEECGGIY